MGPKCVSFTLMQFWGCLFWVGNTFIYFETVLFMIPGFKEQPNWFQWKKGLDFVNKGHIAKKCHVQIVVISTWIVNKSRKHLSIFFSLNVLPIFFWYSFYLFPLLLSPKEKVTSLGSDKATPGEVRWIKADGRLSSKGLKTQFISFLSFSW